MSERPTFEKLARIHKLAFEQTNRHMPAKRLAAVTEWTAAHPEYVPSFSTRLEAAIEWTKQNPDKFRAMLTDFDAALNFLNTSDTAVDATLFPNIAAYRAHKKGALPLVGGSVAHNAQYILTAARDSANKLRWGETIKPKDGDYYAFHSFVNSDQGMVAASLTDLYENYTRKLGLYPDQTGIDAIVANAITEAVYLTNPDGELFQTYKNRDDGWIYGYDGFSSAFQQRLYGDTAAQQPH